MKLRSITFSEWVEINGITSELLHGDDSTHVAVNVDFDEKGEVACLAIYNNPKITKSPISS